MAKEKLRNFLQPVAADKDASGTSLLERFNARTQWLKDNNVRRPKVEAVPTKPLTEKEKATAKRKAEIDAIKNESDTATKGCTQYAIRQRGKLHARFADVLAEQPRAKCCDRNSSQDRRTRWP